DAVGRVDNQVDHHGDHEVFGDVDVVPLLDLQHRPVVPLLGVVVDVHLEQRVHAGHDVGVVVGGLVPQGLHSGTPGQRPRLSGLQGFVQAGQGGVAEDA